MKKDSEVLFSVFDGLCDLKGDVEEIEASASEDRVLISSYRDTPVEGSTCTITYGLSEIRHPEWIGGRPELFMCVNSLSPEWGRALGLSVLMWRHESLFEQGSVVHFGRPISSDSELDGFFLYASDMIDQQDQRIDLRDRVVNVTQAYPIFGAEVPLLRRIGSSAFFWDLEIDFCDVSRKPSMGFN